MIKKMLVADKFIH